MLYFSDTAFSDYSSGFYRVLWMKKISVPWKPAKGTLNSFLLRKMKKKSRALESISLPEGSLIIINILFDKLYVEKRVIGFYFCAINWINILHHSRCTCNHKHARYRLKYLDFKFIKFWKNKRTWLPKEILKFPVLWLQVKITNNGFWTV